MLSKQELYHQAMREISAHRQIARTLANDNLAALEAAFPSFAKANLAVRQAGVQMTIAAVKGQDTAKAKEALDAANTARSAALVALGRSSDALLPKFNCLDCGDTGDLNGKTCPCVRKRMRALRRKEIADTTSLSITKFEQLDCSYYPNITDVNSGMNVQQYMRTVLGDLKEYAEDFDRDSCNLLLFGNSGLGKTHAALAIAGIVLEKGFDVIYISSPDFFSTVENHHFNNNPDEERALLEAVTQADLLILDDLGTELVSSFTISTLYTLLNNRTANKSPIIFTSNIVDGTLLEKRYTEKISSRISGMCEPFQFMGDDIRTIKTQV
ncbi:MAG: ATP-binding protein [Faecalibacterium sp.]